MSAPERWSITATPISPIHIGSGQAIEPHEYVLDENQNGRWLKVVNLNRVFADLSERQRSEFLRVIDRGDFPGVREWLRRTARDAHTRFVIQVQDPVYKQLRDNADNPNRLGEIELFTRRADSGEPYLPGSSIKGAIRTALLGHELESASHEQERAWASIAANDRRGGTDFEAEVLGHMETGNDGRRRTDLYRDPLRQLALADILLPEDSCYIDQVQIVNKKRLSASRSDDGRLMYRDMTWSVLDGERLECPGECRLLSHLADRAKMGGKELPRSLTIQEICEACNAFYKPRLEQELEQFPIDKTKDEDPQGMLAAEAERISGSSCLIRLGRHSHFECVTVGTPYARPPNRGAGKSRSRADGRLPLGWLRLDFAPENHQ